MTEVACWAHTRRQFRKALAADAPRIRTVLLLIAQIYRVEKGARRFVSSCELAKINPFVWFRDVLARIGEHSVTQLDELLPHNWTPKQA